MGLTAAVLWGLSWREYRALRKQWLETRKWQTGLVAALRADIYNTAGKSFQQTFEPADFMPGAAANDVEARARKLMEMGYPPAEAVAMASSKQTREHKLHVLTSVMSEAERRKQKTGSKRRKA